jgi:hypothetical protein
MKIQIANRTTLETARKSSKKAEAMFEFHVDAFLEGLTEIAPKGSDYGLDEETSAHLRDRRVLDAIAS